MQNLVCRSEYRRPRLCGSIGMAHVIVPQCRWECTSRLCLRAERRLDWTPGEQCGTHTAPQDSRGHCLGRYAPVTASETLQHWRKSPCRFLSVGASPSMTSGEAVASPCSYCRRAGRTRRSVSRSVPRAIPSNTFYWIALFSPRDPWNARVRTFNQTLEAYLCLPPTK